MHIEEIYKILQTKPHNSHYLKRYVNYISRMLQVNKDDYVEAHHICPKAIDLFPEYTKFSDFPWNKVYLTPRQHIIAHLILWKTYGNSQTVAIDNMLGFGNSMYTVNSWFPTCEYLRYVSKIKEERYYSSIGVAMYATPDGKYYKRLHYTDKEIIEKSLVFYASDKQRDNGKNLSFIGHTSLTGTKKYNNGIREKMVRIHPGEGWILGRLPRNEDQKKTHKIAVKDSFIGKKIYNDGVKNLFLFPDEVLDIHHEGAIPRNVSHYYTDINKEFIIVINGKHTKLEKFIKIKSREGIRLLNHINHVNKIFNNLNDIKDFINWCKGSNGFIDSNKSIYFKANKDRICDMIKISRNSSFSDILNFIT